MWAAYLPGVLWIFGYPLQLFMANYIFFYLQIVALYNFFEVVFFGKYWLDFLERPFRRLLVQWNIFLASLFFTALPLVNSLVIPLLSWLAVQDYYDYKY